MPPQPPDRDVDELYTTERALTSSSDTDPERATTTTALIFSGPVIA